jgi:hypothetical protein
MVTPGHASLQKYYADKYYQASKKDISQANVEQAACGGTIVAT